MSRDAWKKVILPQKIVEGTGRQADYWGDPALRRAVDEITISDKERMERTKVFIDLATRKPAPKN